MSDVRAGFSKKTKFFDSLSSCFLDSSCYWIRLLSHYVRALLLTDGRTKQAAAFLRRKTVPLLPRRHLHHNSAALWVCKPSKGDLVCWIKTWAKQQKANPRNTRVGLNEQIAARTFEGKPVTSLKHHWSANSAWFWVDAGLGVRPLNATEEVSASKITEVILVWRIN